MKILKPGKVDTRKLTCPMCECEFVCGEYDYTFWDNDRLLVECPCCHYDMPFYCGEPYEEPTPTQTDRERLAQLLVETTQFCNFGEKADHLIANGVTFREA